MMEMLADSTRALKPGIERAAAAAIANTGRRLGATNDDIRTALAVLFGEAQS